MTGGCSRYYVGGVVRRSGFWADAMRKAENCMGTVQYSVSPSLLHRQAENMGLAQPRSHKLIGLASSGARGSAHCR